MPKKGVSAISGNVSPVVGEKNTYHVSDWYPDTPTSERDLKAVTWELFRKRSNGKFTTTHVRKKGDSSFTFGEASLGHTYRLEGYLHEPEGGGLIITPKQNKIPQICKTELYYTDGTKGSKFSFMEKLRAKAYCVNMFNKEVLFTLWEDDAKGAGHHVSNTAIETQKSRVDENGLAVAEFMLTKALMRKAMKGEANAKELEFYVTVEYYKHNKHATENVEVENPYAQYYNPKPYQPPVIPKAKGSPAEQKPASQKEEKGIVDTAIDKMKELWDWRESKGTATKEKSPTMLRPEGRSAVVVREVKREEEKEDKEKLIIFPLLVKPENDTDNKWGKSRNWTAKQGSNMTTFNSNRDKGKRKHAARDLYTKPYETIVAIADGVVLEVKPFYCKTHQITIRHTLKDGRDFIIRYGELDPKSIKIKENDKVTQKMELGKTGKLLKYIPRTKEYIPLMKIEGETVFMIHFEHFMGTIGFDIKKNPLSNGSKPYNRRSDLIDSLAILQEGYNNSFGIKAMSNDNGEEGFTEHHARKALLYIYNKYGRDIAVIVEKMYRLETTHFSSERNKNW
ncbi:M23 family metallopeptidase [Flavobacterium sp. B17]|uniref:M23 family metallopeptidase n=1 Tax=Flavobacterium sp. B17 TaxID=95618 RepID=UPI00034D554F|nr:M23 family metallopeptidase [Flavobacterium sp. B17]